MGKREKDMKEFEKLKWQIHAESSLTQMFLDVILWKLFGRWVGYFAFISILGNLYTLLKSVIRLHKLDKDYFK